MNPGITPQQAKRFYDRFGAKQDTQGWYEDPAVERMVELGRFEEAHAIFELGFGTGRLAERLLRDELPADCSYSGREVSATMADLAHDRLADWSDRVDLRQIDATGAAREGDQATTPQGSPEPLSPQSVDRYLATYVIDLMERDMIRDVFREAHAALTERGLLCVVSLTGGVGPFSKTVSWLWERVQAIAPEKVGGCRPISPSSLLQEDATAWRIVTREVICRFGVCSEVCIATPAHEGREA